uniref:Ion transport domain-containing protein n=1 Tax=Parascaris univalens TaxID=6257 RepID=A0A914ZUN0_PARUN
MTALQRPHMKAHVASTYRCSNINHHCKEITDAERILCHPSCDT